MTGIEPFHPPGTETHLGWDAGVLITLIPTRTTHPHMIRGVEVVAVDKATLSTKDTAHGFHHSSSCCRQYTDGGSCASAHVASHVYSFGGMGR